MFFFFNDYKSDLLEAFEQPHIKELAESNEFYFQKAKTKFDELLVYEISDVDISSLIDLTKQPNFSFVLYWNGSFSTTILIRRQIRLWQRFLTLRGGGR